MQIVDNDQRNNLVKFEKDSPFRIWVIEWWILGRWNFSELYTLFSVSQSNFFKIKILNEINFLLIMIYILVQFNCFIYSPLLTYINALPVVYWPPQCIAIDHSSIGLKRLTIQPVFNEAWLCVLTRILSYITSIVCTATLKCSSVKPWRIVVTTRLWGRYQKYLHEGCFFNNYPTSPGEWGNS